MTDFALYSVVCELHPLALRKEKSVEQKLNLRNESMTSTRGT
jgi:hypothetical protein